MGFGIERADPDQALAWIAQAYDNRRALRFPPGLVYQSLKAGKEPRKEYFDHPEDYLPDEYLDVIGWFEDDEAAPVVDVDAPAVQAEEIKQPADPSVQIEILPGHSALQAWQMAVDQIRQEMPRNAFEAYVAGAELIRLDGDEFIVWAPTQFARDWLADRLTSTMVRILTGICARVVRVTYVCTQTLIENVKG